MRRIVLSWFACPISTSTGLIVIQSPVWGSWFGIRGHGGAEQVAESSEGGMAVVIGWRGGDSHDR